MNVEMYCLKFLRKIFINKTPYLEPFVDDCDEVSDIIFDELISNKPSMIARFGAFELAAVVNYLGVKNNNKSIISFIKGEQSDWWWNETLISNMHINAGFFPPTVAKIEEFCELMLRDISGIDVLGSWQSNERFVKDSLKNSIKVSRGKIDPFWAVKPWTHALENKKVLVIHPFVKTIENQYKKRELLFANNLLPEFELKTIKAVQTIAGMPSDFQDWFEALESMKKQIDETQFDICLIGAGAYGLSLAAYVKRMGKKSVHMGGSLQLLFGIRGNRWDNEKIVGRVNYQSLFNEHWVRPLGEETPTKKDNVEGGCYW